MNRRIVAFHCDDLGDWVAELSCGHNQHVRHQPPFQLRPWVEDDDERHAHLDTEIECPLCDYGEPAASPPDSGGESACWVDRVCVTCGAVLDGRPHEHDEC